MGQDRVLPKYPWRWQVGWPPYGLLAQPSDLPAWPQNGLPGVNLGLLYRFYGLFLN